MEMEVKTNVNEGIFVLPNYLSKQINAVCSCINVTQCNLQELKKLGYTGEVYDIFDAIMFDLKRAKDDLEKHIGREIVGTMEQYFDI